jgi:hypothetical protein
VYLLTRDEAQRIAIKIAKLPESLKAAAMLRSLALLAASPQMISSLGWSTFQYTCSVLKPAVSR